MVPSNLAYIRNVAEWKDAMKVQENKGDSEFVSFHSAAESARFGRKVVRYTLTGVNAAPMLDAIRADAADLAIVRIPTSRSDVWPELSTICSNIVLGDCLVVYRRDNLSTGLPRGFRNSEFVLREAAQSDCEMIDQMTEVIFAGYRNHYSSNPSLRRFNLVEGYKEWARSFITCKGKKCLIGYLGHTVCGYTTVQMGPKDGEVVLTGVLPQYRSKGVYRDLIRGAVGLLMKEGLPETVLSTQVENTIVQRVWVSEGFFLSHSYFTMHLNGPKKEN